VDDNGHVVEGDANYNKANGQPAHLSFAPDGWRDTLIKYGRNTKYWGLFRDFTVPMKFVGDGAKILKHLMWTQGVEAKCYLGIAKLDRNNTGYNYYSWYLSEINFSKYKENKTGCTVEALEGGLSKLLKSNEGTVYTIPIEDNEHIWVLMDGMGFDFNRVYTVVSDQQAIDTDVYWLGMVETSHEGQTLETPFQDVFPASSTVYPNDSWIMNTFYDRAVRVHGTVKITFAQSVTAIIRAEVNDGLSSGGTVQHVLDSHAGTAGEQYTAVIDQTFSVPANHRMHVKHFMFNPLNTGLHYTITEGELTVDYVFRGQPTYIKAYYPYKLLEKLMEKMTGSQYRHYSNFLSAMRDYCITCGDAIRGIDDAKIKTSMQDYFKSFFARFSTGLSIKDELLIIEHLSAFFDSTIIADLGIVDEAESSVAEDLMANTIKAGYAKQEYADANGKYEVNQGQIWSTPITKIIRELDMQSPYRADPFGIELLRINYEQKKTTDTENDNDNFFLNIGTEEFYDSDLDIHYYKLNRPAYTSVTGIPHPDSAFNLGMTPKWGLFFNSAYLHSIFDLMDPLNFKQESADKNTDLVTELSGVTVTENEIIQIGGLEPQLFRPYYITIKTKVPINLLELLKANPYGKIKFTYNGTVFYGYLFDGGIKPANQEGQTWKLISAAGNDLTKFNVL
jgi:hypothetical protein